MIFTLISLTVYQSIMVTSKGSVIVNKKLKQMNRLQRVFDILEQDISHAIIYSDPQDNNILNSGVKIGKSLLESDDFGILFLCDISTNTNYYSRSQTLGYRLRNNSLEKLSYGINKKQPKISKVIDGVTAFHIQVYHKNRWLKEWNESAYLPEGVELVISLENIGVVRKVFILLNYTI